MLGNPENQNKGKLNLVMAKVGARGIPLVARVSLASVRL